MKGRVVYLDRIKDQAAAALIVDGVLEDLILDPPETAPPGPGAIYRAVVDRVIKGMGGVFVRLGGAETGFLRHVKGLRPGDSLIVQVSGYAEPGKAVPVTANALFKSRYVIVTPQKPGINAARSISDDALRDTLLETAHEIAGDTGFGLILRSAAAGALAQGQMAEIEDDIASTVSLARDVLADGAGTDPELLLDAPDAHLRAWRDWADPAPDQVFDTQGCFATEDVLEAIDAAQSAQVPLPGGASLFIEPTRALTAVDVNTGAATSPASALKANIDAARSLPRALRLRGLGGQVVIDFAPLAKKDRRQIEQVLKSAFRADSIDTTLVGWTPLGHFELLRKRERIALHQAV